MSDKEKDSSDKKQSNSVAYVKKLEKRIELLEIVIAKMAHFSGNNRILVEHGLKTWEPGQKDMSRW